MIGNFFLSIRKYVPLLQRHVIDITQSSRAPEPATFYDFYLPEMKDFYSEFFSMVTLTISLRFYSYKHFRVLYPWIP